MEYLLITHELPPNGTIDVTQTDYRGDTLLHHAVQYDNVELVELLLRLGAEPYAQNAMGETPILRVVSLGSKAVQDFFKKEGIQTKGAKPLDAVNRQVELYNRIEAMEKAIRMGDLPAVNALLDDHTVNIHQLRPERSPMRMAVEQQDKEMIELLLQKGANLALADYGQAIALNPDDAHVYVNRGNTYNALGRYEEALADYGQAIALNPDDANAYLNIGALYGNQGKLREALHFFEKAAQLGDQTGAEYAARARQMLGG